MLIVHKNINAAFNRSKNIKKYGRDIVGVESAGLRKLLYMLMGKKRKTDDPRTLILNRDIDRDREG